MIRVCVCVCVLDEGLVVASLVFIASLYSKGCTFQR